MDCLLVYFFQILIRMMMLIKFALEPVNIIM